MTRGILFLFALSTVGTMSAVFSGCISAKDEKAGGRPVNPPSRTPLDRLRNSGGSGHGLKYFKGVGWRYVPPGVTDDLFTMTAEKIYEEAQSALEEKDNTKALFFARWLHVNHPNATLAPEARRIVAKIYEFRGFHEHAFQEYQALLDAHPNYEPAKRAEVTQRMYEIAGEYLEGKWYRWKLPYQERMYLPLFSSMNRTAKLYNQVVTNAPYGPLAASAQFGVGDAHERALRGFWGFFADEGQYKKATDAYQLLADRYQRRQGDAPRPNQAEIDRVVAEAGFRVAAIYEIQANEGVYDQSMAQRAINAYTDFKVLNANNENLKPKLDDATERINRLHLERVRGALAVAEFYERGDHWIAAIKYYGETSARAGQVMGMAPEESPIYVEADRINQQAAASLLRISQRTVREALELAGDLAGADAAKLNEMEDRKLAALERVSRRIELNLRLPEAELRRAVEDDEAQFQAVLALRKRADVLLTAAQTELDRREAKQTANED